MQWALRDLPRFLQEHKDLERLQKEADWLVACAWRIDAAVEVDMDFEIHGKPYQVTLTYLICRNTSIHPTPRCFATMVDTPIRTWWVLALNGGRTIGSVALPVRIWRRVSIDCSPLKRIRSSRRAFRLSTISPKDRSCAVASTAWSAHPGFWRRWRSSRITSTESYGRPLYCTFQ